MLDMKETPPGQSRLQLQEGGRLVLHVVVCVCETELRGSRTTDDGVMKPTHKQNTDQSVAPEQSSLGSLKSGGNEKGEEVNKILNVSFGRDQKFLTVHCQFYCKWSK